MRNRYITKSELIKCKNSILQCQSKIKKKFICKNKISKNIQKASIYTQKGFNMLLCEYYFNIQKLSVQNKFNSQFDPSNPCYLLEIVKNINVVIYQ